MSGCPEPASDAKVPEHDFADWHADAERRCQTLQGSTVEILVPAISYSSKARRFIRAIADACPLPCSLQHQPQKDDSLLIVYGSQMVELARGRKWAYIDLGYWGRENRADYPMRLAFGDKHPWRDLERSFPKREHPPLRNSYRPDGKIIVVGQGQKSCRHIYSEAFGAWERQTLAKAQAFSSRPVVYRPKPGRPCIPGAPCEQGPVDTALRGASLVITRHSNVGVDAIIHGIPVATDDGAARALYGPDWTNEPVSDAQRRKFLNALAWHNWRPSEAKLFWTFTLSRFATLSETGASTPAY